MEDVIEIINRNKNSAGGINNVSNKIKKMLNYEHIKTLTNHFNKMWNNQCFPESNYRIISLLNVLHKTFSKLIKQLICNFINQHQLLPDDAYGFREGVGCNEYAVRLTQLIEKNNKDNFKTIILTIDITKAFDKVNTNILLKTLTNMKMERKYVYWIMELLRYRRITIGEDDCAAHLTASEGLPQGDILSPILFNLYTVELHK